MRICILCSIQIDKVDFTLLITVRNILIAIQISCRRLRLMMNACFISMVMWAPKMYEFGELCHIALSIKEMLCALFGKESNSNYQFMQIHIIQKVFSSLKHPSLAVTLKLVHCVQLKIMEYLTFMHSMVGPKVSLGAVGSNVNRTARKRFQGIYSLYLDSNGRGS